LVAILIAIFAFFTVSRFVDVESVVQSTHANESWYAQHLLQLRSGQVL
jgi:hypothetical protein